MKKLRWSIPDLPRGCSTLARAKIRENQPVNSKDILNVWNYWHCREAGGHAFDL
jgi:hypothetical protein